MTVKCAFSASVCGIKAAVAMDTNVIMRSPESGIVFRAVQHSAVGIQLEEVGSFFPPYN